MCNFRLRIALFQNSNVGSRGTKIFRICVSLLSHDRKSGEIFTSPRAGISRRFLVLRFLEKYWNKASACHFKSQKHMFNFEKMTAALATRFAVFRTFLQRLSYSTMPGPVEVAITDTLTQNLQPVHLEVINESYMHNVPKDAESHFKVLVVSEKFENLPLIKRHRLVNTLIQEKLKGDFVHALSIEAKTPSQWDPSYKVEPSPNCKGGFGK